MKTTIELPDELLLRAKQAALARGTSLKEVIESALLQALGRPAASPPPLRTVVWPPANIEAPSVSSDDILQMIRSERDRLAEPATKPAPKARVVRQQRRK